MYHFISSRSHNLLRQCNIKQSWSKFLSATVRLCNEKNDEEADELKNNPFFDKYSEKIKKAKESGIYERKNNSYDQLKRETEQWKKKLQYAEQKLSSAEKKHSDNKGTKLPKYLADLIHLDRLHDKSVDEISDIWTEYFKTKESICAIIPSDVYSMLSARSKEFPMFLYPLPKDQGYEFVFSQFDENRCFFTSLINYQMYDTNAPWQLCITYYTELKESKGIVLMASELDSKALNTLEAQCLAQLQQLFYTGDNEKFVTLLKLFNTSPEVFKYMDLVKAVEESNMFVKPSA